MSDQEIVEKINSGDYKAFKALFDCHVNTVMNICYKMIGNREEAEDVCQEVFFKVYKSIGTFKHRSKFSTWIFRIAVNLSLNHLRKKKKLSRISLSKQNAHINSEILDSLSASSMDRPDVFFEQKEKEKIVWNAVHSLPANQRVVLILQKYEGFSGKEIAKILDCSLSSVQSRLYRAKENLYKKLLPYLGKL